MNPSFDISTRKLIFQEEKLDLKFVNSLTDTLYLNQVVAGLLTLEKASDLMQALINGSIEITQDISRAKKMLFSGCSVMTYRSTFYILETRSYPGRSINQPDTEKSVRGSKDGFNENIILNVGLIRRRIRDEHLVMKMMEIGETSHSDVCLAYMSTRVDSKILETVSSRLKHLHVDEIVMSDRALEELLLGQSYHPFPFVRYCERPDIVASHILQGGLALIVDTSSSVILLPICVLDLLEHVEEHRETPFVGTIFRFVRLLAVFISIYLVPFWLTLIQVPQQHFSLFVIPHNIEIHELLIQVFIVEGAIELLRLATIYTPSALSSAMGLIAAILVGQMAIDLGLFTPEVLLYSAISNVAGYACPNYELGSANKLFKWIMILAVGLFSRYGFVLMNFILITYLANLKPLGKPYFKPIIPFDGKALMKYIIRFPKKALE